MRERDDKEQRQVIYLNKKEQQRKKIEEREGEEGRESRREKCKEFIIREND